MSGTEGFSFDYAVASTTATVPGPVAGAGLGLGDRRSSRLAATAAEEDSNRRGGQTKGFGSAL
jgi:hypothetical protein